jgi:flavorubredoxin
MHTPTLPTRIAPIEIAPETYVISNHVGEGVAPQVVHLNSMVIRAAEPVVVDCGAPIHRDTYLEDLFSLVEPEDVRWVFLSHEDVDHFGNVEAVMAACPNATLVASWFLCERLAAGGLHVPPTRWRWIGHGETLDAGDRTLVALRPPVYDSPVTRGLFDSTTGAYWASDAFATPVAAPARCVSELDPEQWTEGFMAFQQWNSPWIQLVDEARFLREVSALERLDVRTIATCHGPTIPMTHVARAFELMARVPSVDSIPQPGQPVLDQIVAQLLTAG